MASKWVGLVLLLFTLQFTFSEVFGFEDDLKTLLSFKESITSDPLNLLSNWESTASYCNWYGIVCDGSLNRVIGVNLTGNGNTLAGTLPESMSKLSELRTLVVSHNGFYGEVPSSIGNLKFLEVLELQGNNFSRKIPYQISMLQSLRLLNLSFNSFSGEIPDGLIGYGNLSVIDMSNNKLTGRIVIRGNGSGCLFLRHLKLSNNFLEKEIPREIGRCRNLRTLLLDGNFLQGRIPAEVGGLSELRVLDVSTNCLTEMIPKELGFCRKLSVIVLTNSSNFVGDGVNFADDVRLEFNAFEGVIPYEVLMLPNLQILWAPRANLEDRLPDNWSESCSLRVVHLGLNAFTGVVPSGLGMCKNLTFLDLSSNYFVGYFPMQLQVSCMTYFNISMNNMSGSLPSFHNGFCENSMITYGLEPNVLTDEDIQCAYSNIPVWGSQTNAASGLVGEGGNVIVHDFSWNRFAGLIPSFSIGDRLLKRNMSIYQLSLNNNVFDGSLVHELVPQCNDLLFFSVNLSVNHISGDLFEYLPRSCQHIRDFEAAYNHIGGWLGPGICNLTMLQYFDLRGNRLSGSLPTELGNLKFLKSFLLGMNDITGEIPSHLGQLTSLVVLDLSNNALTGYIPENLGTAKDLQTVLLNNNRLYGKIPSSLSSLSNLTLLNVSFNNLSGDIPPLSQLFNCSWFRGNKYLNQCSVARSPESPPELVNTDVDGKRQNHRKKSIIIAMVTSASVTLSLSLLIVLVSISGKRKLKRHSSLREKVVVTFSDAPAELSYDNVVRATGNFSVRSLIGTGGFGSTYKAEVVPGFLVAIKRLSIGRFQGTQQFDAEIRTLGRIRHKNLVTLIGYYVGETEMFLIYNYLSGGNLETFIHERSGDNMRWSVICKIALDIAQALAYLHYSCVPRILHRDIKPSNILLDEDLNAYLSDFGLARLLEVSQTHATTDVAGTFGYVAPEYATTCRVSDKSDVYSFGVVLLELMSGKKSIDPSFSEYGNGFNIVAWAKLLIKEGRPSEFFFHDLWEEGHKENLLGMLKLASSCTVESLTVRPSMKQVLEQLKQLR